VRIKSGRKLRSGLYFKEVNSYDDRVVFDVYASRPLGVDELGDLKLTDTLGTQYERIDPEDVIDGRGSIVFKPGVPDGVNFQLSQPGWGLRTYHVEDTA
jgi:hypothetical protein